MPKGNDRPITTRMLAFMAYVAGKTPERPKVQGGASRRACLARGLVVPHLQPPFYQLTPLGYQKLVAGHDLTNAREIR